MSRNQPTDGVIVSVSCFLPEGVSGQALIRSGFVRRPTIVNGRVAYTSPSSEIDDLDVSTRQTRVAEWLSELLMRLKAAGVDRDFLQANEGTLRVNISLLPRQGFADLDLAASAIEQWSAIGASLRLDVIL